MTSLHNDTIFAFMGNQH
jgi:hypothetical protein